MAIRTVDGKFEGVASIQLSLSHIAGHLLEVENLPGLKEAMLVNRLGVTMVHTADDAEPGERSHFVPTAALEAIKQNDSGVLEIEGDEPTIVAFFALQSVEWHYVAIVDRAEFLRSASPHVGRERSTPLESWSP